ncbi:hypothetical protein E2K60_25710, partial [Escherichia coli]
MGQPFTAASGNFPVGISDLARLVARITLTRNVLALSRSGGLYCLVGRIQDINAVRQVKTALL